MTSPNSIFNHPTLQLLEKCKTLSRLKQIHAQTITTGLAFHTYPLSKLLLSSSTINLTYALTIFNQITNPTVFLFNTLISAIIAHRRTQTHIAFSLYNRIFSHNNLKPNNFTYPSLFKACGSNPWVRHGLALHSHVLKFLEPPYDRFVQGSLVNFYANCGELDSAQYLFDQINEPDLPTWNCILTAYARNASDANWVCNINNVDSCLSLEVFDLFRKMQNSEIRPNEITIVALLSACTDLGVLSLGLWAHAYLIKHNLKLNCYVGTSLIDMYAKCGCIGLAHQVFDNIPNRDTFCYNAMIGGFSIHGYGQKAVDLYKTMRFEGLLPDNVTFIVTMFGCSHVGLVEEGRKIFESIREVYGIEPTLEHYGCLVDLLARAGWLEEAKEKISKMPMKPNAVLWRSLLGGARVHGNLALGEVAMKHLMELETETSGNYVLLSNMYARVNKWEDVRRVRELMKGKYGIEKMPGSSLVEINGAMHEFIRGDKGHPFTENIYLKVEEMNRRMIEHGYMARIKEVLFDIEEEEKEDALSYHSERLAIAFALIATNDESGPIRIMKNLRVCEDCHASSKLISMIYEREIIVRDRNRFHHFKDGSCSCFDYW